MTMRRSACLSAWIAVSVAIAAHGAALPTARELRDAVRRDVRRMPTLLRQYAFADLRAEGLTFMPGPGKGKVETVTGRWLEQEAVRLDRGWLQGEPVDVPERGFTVTCWFRCHGMGGLTHYKGKPAYSTGGVAAVGTGYYDGWRIVLLPSSGRVQFDIGRPEGGAVSAVCRTGVERGRWHHLAATWDRRAIAVYLDGRRRAETAYDGEYTPASAGRPLRVGECGVGVGTVKVDVAELAMFGEALRPEMIARMVDTFPAQVDAVIACLMRGDRAARDSARTTAERERAAREEYAKILELDPSENAVVMSNHHAIARLRLATSLQREGLFDRARQECRALADDEAAAQHYRARAMLLAGDTYRDERQYGAAREAYRRMQEFFTGRHENWRVEALQRLADVEGLEDGEPFINARQRRIARISRPARELYVAPDGNDANPGTKAEPLGTLEGARDAVQQLKVTGALPNGGVAIYLRGGVYPRTAPFELSEADSGRLEAPIVYRSCPGEKAILSGGIELKGFQPVTAASVPKRLPKEARAHVVALDLRKAGVTDFGSLKPRGFGLKPVPAHLELFFNDVPMQLARWPNPVGKVEQDFATVAGLTGEQKVNRGRPMGVDGQFVYGGERPERWREEPDAWLYGYWARWYAGRHLPVLAVEPQKKTIRLGPRVTRRGSSRFTGGMILKGAPYFGVNLLCELDGPGEWYLDRDTGMLYFWPPSAIEKGRAVVSVLEQSLLSLDGASHVVFRGLTLEAGRADAVRIDRGEGVLLAGCVIRNMGSWGVVVGGMGGGNDALPDLTRGGRNHGVIGCDIAHTGDGGVSLMGGDVRTLTPSGHFIENCHLHHFDRWNRGAYQPGINLDGVGCRASHNLLHDGPHQAVRVRRNDHVFEYNEVHDTPYEAREMGLYYMYGRSRVLGERGNVARYNNFHHVPYTTALAKGFVGGGTFIFLIDHMNGGMTIYGNLFHQLEYPGTIYSGGRENMIENNVFYQCIRAVTLEDRSWVYNAENRPPNHLLENYLRGVRHDRPPWSVRYPQLATILDKENPALPENNLVARNISVKVVQFLRAVPVTRDLATIKSNWEGRDPGFDDPDNGNFAIRPDSTVFGAIGFGPIPVERIGLYQDELRATWPVRHEAGTHSQESAVRRAPESKPTCLARPRTAAIAIDGQLDPTEWDGLKREDAVVLGQSPYGDPTNAPKSYAWLRRDDECLYIALLNEVNGDKPLTKAKSWWQSDMMEVIIEGQTGVNTQGWWPDERELGPLFYLVGNFKGEFDSIQVAGLPADPAAKLRRTARYGARVRDASCWTAEWRIPFASVCLDPARSTGCCFNIGVGKPGTPEGKWAVWVGTKGPNWEVWNAGRLLLRERGR